MRTGQVSEQRAGQFWARVDRDGSCWLWQGKRNKQGYGVTSYQHRPVFAHRLAWWLADTLQATARERDALAAQVKALTAALQQVAWLADAEEPLSVRAGQIAQAAFTPAAGAAGECHV